MAGATSPLPELFVIKADSAKPQKPENETYLVRTRLTDGHWEPSPRGLTGTSELQWFLRSNQVDGNRINSAIEELSRTRTTTVRARKVVLLNVVTAIAAGGAILYAWITYNQWKQAGSDFRSQQKAWVSPVETIATSLAPDQQQFVYMYGYTRLKNSGLTPAFRVYAMAGVAASYDTLENAMNGACEAAKREMTREVPLSKGQPTQLGVTIFPTQETTLRFGPIGGARAITTQSPLVPLCIYI